MKTASRRLPLAPGDHLFTGLNAYPISFAFFYPNHMDPDELHISLEKTLQEFWPLRSRLVKVADHSYAFQVAEDGLSFVVSHSDKGFDDEEDPSVYLDIVESVLAEPLTRIKLTQTPHGSVLGVSISHALVDGFSYFHFLSSWSRIARGQRILNPVHDRRRLIPTELRCEETITPNIVFDRCGVFWSEMKRGFPDNQLEEDRVSLSKDLIREMRAEAEGECGVPFFDNDVITAYIWREHGASWADVDEDTTIYVTMPFDFRRVLREVPRLYFGNALVFVTASIEIEELRRASLGELALLVRDAVHRVNERYVRQSALTLECLLRQRGMHVIEEIEVRHPQRGLVVTNISRLPIQDLDFGQGAPSRLMVTASARRGAAILPGDNGVEVMLFPPTY
ncbi:MAG: hypothetical protein GTO18_10935 [Anaerolineales bacterium]|nr:hypothetical protein [Anaerolineales bacterium]